jgi:hypothetical protein
MKHVILQLVDRTKNLARDSFGRRDMEKTYS